MSKEERTPEEWDDAFEAIIDGPDQEPLYFYVDYGPIDPEDPEEDAADVPRYRTLQEAIEAWKEQLEAKGEEGPA